MLYEVIKDNRTGTLFLDKVGTQLRNFETYMARSNNKADLARLYPMAKDITKPVTGAEEPGQVQADEP